MCPIGFVRPQLFCHGLADDDDESRIGCVTGGEVPALEQRDPHGMDVFWCRDPDRHLGLSTMRPGDALQPAIG